MTTESAKKAWDTRIANGWVPKSAAGQASRGAAVPTERPKDVDLIMSIKVGQTGGISRIVCTFGFESSSGNLSDIPTSDSAMRDICLMAVTDSADKPTSFTGYGEVIGTIENGTVADFEAVTKTMRDLNMVISKSAADSEDSSFAMAVQAVTWNRRVNWIEFDGNRTKRGPVYSLVENICTQILDSYKSAAVKPVDNKQGRK